jgi:hypothetical protein
MKVGMKLGGTQLPRHEASVIGLVESIEEIGCTPETEDPRDDNAGMHWAAISAQATRVSPQ